MVQHDLIYIEWLDSAAVEGWQPIENPPHGSVYCRSVGFLIEQTPTLITIAASLSSEEYSEAPSLGLGWLSIPAAAITKMLPLRIVVDTARPLREHQAHNDGRGSAE